MGRSALVTAHHRARHAIRDLRQSTPQQVLTTQERLPLPYALRQRALPRAWREEAIDGIAADWGPTAVTAAHRAGVNALVPQVTLSQGGLMRSRAGTR